MIEKIRRIITGETEDGRGVFTHVEEVEPLMLGRSRWYGVWGWDQPPTFPYHVTEPYVPRSAFPAPEGGGLRITVVEFPAGAGVADGADSADGVALDMSSVEVWQRLLAAQPHGHVLDAATGMHSTDSIDIGFVLSGELCVEQDDEEIALRPGDVYVQNGAKHAWRNRTSEPAMVAFLLMSFGGRTAPRKIPEGAAIVDVPEGE
jgi:mannose-6-phosphate isomerase-like protein (cupin superfamily)